MAETAELATPPDQVVNPSVDDGGAVDAEAKRAGDRAFVRNRGRRALLADLRAAWRWHMRESAAYHNFATETAALATQLKSGEITVLEALDRLGPEMVIWMIGIRHEIERDGG